MDDTNNANKNGEKSAVQNSSVQFSAVIDRFEEDWAVLLIGDEEIKVDFPKQLLDKLQAKEGDWLRLNIARDDAATLQAMREAKELLASIQQQNK